jgi:hypothetical protein
MDQFRKAEDDRVQEVIKSTDDPAKQLDRIAIIRGWYRGWYDPTDAANVLIQQYMNGSLALDDAVSHLTDPIDRLYTSGDDGWSAYTQEQVARSQRPLWSADDARQLWGEEQEIAQPPSGPETTLEDLLWRLWFAIIHTAKKLPWADARAQTRLLALLRALRARPDPPRPAHTTVPMRRDWVYESGRLWSRLLLLGPSLAECWTAYPGGAAGFAAVEVGAWVNVHAFVARVTVDGVVELGGYGRRALRGNLECDYERGGGPVSGEELMAAFVPVAAVWILVAGRRIWGLVRAQDGGSGDGLAGESSRAGRNAWTRVGWECWREKLLGFSTREGLRDEARRVARDAYDFMTRVEVEDS